jgi:hypothetical protein
MQKFSIFHIEGGLGKHIAATAVAQCIKNNHPDRELIVVCAYPEIFINLPFVDRVYRIGVTPYFYKDYILDKDSIIFKHEPYFTTEHIHKKLPLIENWCKLYNLTYSGEEPVLKFNIRQLQYAANKWSREKPVMVLQTNGGPLNGQKYLYSWTRDLPPTVSQKIINHFSKDYHIIQVCRDPQQGLSGAEVVTEAMSNIEFLSMILASRKRVLIDSSLQHAAAALKLPSTVIWNGTSSKIFGYSMHDNIQSTLDESFKLPDSYLFDYGFNGALHECPIFNIEEAFNIGQIIESIEKSH